MAAKKTKSADAQWEFQLRRLEQSFESRGIQVRREKLSAGPAFKVKSGGCTFSGSKIIFIDRRLSSEQQLTVLIEHVIDAPFELSESELSHLSESKRELIHLRRQALSNQAA
jgi:hypothetical protein